MGNCLVHEQEKKMVKLMRVDGKILEYLSPLKVHEALSGFPGHAIAESLPVVQHLNADVDMVGGKLYYLLPPKKKTAVEPGEARSVTGASIVRIKVVVSKQELKEMLSSREGVSLGEMIAKLRVRSGMAGGGDGGRPKKLVWRPVLESIPEGLINDFS